VSRKVNQDDFAIEERKRARQGCLGMMIGIAISLFFWLGILLIMFW